ncbi:MAG: DNA repair exonuclease [Promethearchaeota archaeon]|nr:MAG: DNA repair exonuclease [Candidatus Lokiarchaeota archaeon]
MVQIIHSADFHLDPRMTSFLNRDEERRKDFTKNFDYIIEFALKERPDIVLISGDLFDNINPRNPIRNHVVKSFKKLYEKKVKIFAISGNHDEPKSIQNALSPISILDSIEYLDFIQTENNLIGKRELVIDNLKINIIGDSFNIFTNQDQDPLEQREFPKINGDLNLFMTHGSISMFKKSYLGDSIIKETNIPEEIDYVAAGHLHEHLEKTRKNFDLGNITYLVYPGSIEFLSFNENLQNPKGFMFLEFGKHELVSKDFIKLETRPMKQLEIPISSKNEDIFSEIIDPIASLSDPSLILKIILDGKIKTEQIAGIKSSKIVSYGDEHFFKLFLDNYSKLTFESSELVLPDKEHTTPIEIFLHYVDKLIDEEDGRNKDKLVSVKRLSLKTLKKYGVD